VKSLYLKGKKYISATRAAEVTGYSSDYIGQLCRGKKITGNLVGRSWYVLEDEILDYKKKNFVAHKKTLKTRKAHKKVLMMKLNELSRKEKSEKNQTTKKEEVVVPQIKTNPIVPKPVVKKESLPVVSKKIEKNISKPVVLKSVEKNVKKPKQKYSFEKVQVNSIVAIATVLLIVGALTFSSFDNNISSINKNTNQLASSLFSLEGLQSVSSWVKDTAHKIIKPWTSQSGVTVIVENKKTPSVVDNSPSISLAPKEGTGTNIVQAKTIVVQGSNKNYIDTQIAELKKYFLTLPLVSTTAPNVNRYYITNQNDQIMGNISGSLKSSIANIDGSSITNSSITNSSLSGVLTLPSLDQGFVYVGSAGSVNSIASSSVNLSWFNNDSNFISSDNLSNSLYGKIGTSSVLTLGQLTYVTGDNTVASIATTTLSCSGGLSCSQAVIIGSSPIVISIADFPFTVNTGYNSTSTTLGFLNGFFSTASSTISSLTSYLNLSITVLT